jgi:membrane protein implicated in regulation of membrane protease activity
MAWISFVIVVILFYTPVVGLGRFIQEEAATINLGALSLSIDIPIVGHLRLLGYSVGLWLVLWLVIALVDRAIRADVLVRARLRNGMLFASRPHIATHAAVALAQVTLGYVTAKAILMWLAQHVLVEVSPVLAGLLPVELNMQLAVLSVFTLIADYGHRREQCSRYAADIRRNQRIRKSAQKAIVVPTATEQV